jgi:hypothetical protein
MVATLASLVWLPGVALKVLDVMAIIVLFLLLTCLMGSMGYLMRYLIDKLDMRIDANVSLTARQQIVIGLFFALAAAILQMAIATLLIPNTPISEVFEKIRSVENVDGRMNYWWGLWGAATFLLFYFTRPLNRVSK